MWVGCLEFDLLLGDVHSLKQKRALVRPVINELRRRFLVTATEFRYVDLYRRVGIGVACAGAEQRHLAEVLDAVEQFVAGRGEYELLSTSRTFFNTDDS